MSLVPIIQFTELDSRLTDDEFFNTFVKSIGRKVIVSSLFNHLQTAPESLQNAIEMQSDIIESRNTNTSQNVQSSSHMDELPSELTNRICCFLDKSSYFNFTRCSRNIFISAQSPPTLNSIELTVKSGQIYPCIKEQNVFNNTVNLRIKQKPEGSMFDAKYSPIHPSFIYGILSKFNKLKTLNIDICCISEKTVQQLAKDFTKWFPNITTLCLNNTLFSSIGNMHMGIPFMVSLSDQLEFLSLSRRISIPPKQMNFSRLHTLLKNDSNATVSTFSKACNIKRLVIDENDEWITWAFSSLKSLKYIAINTGDAVNPVSVLQELEFTIAASKDVERNIDLMHVYVYMDGPEENGSEQFYDNPNRRDEDRWKPDGQQLQWSNLVIRICRKLKLLNIDWRLHIDVEDVYNMYNSEDMNRVKDVINKHQAEFCICFD
eukprot:479800_1